MTRDKKQTSAKASRGDSPDVKFPLQNRLKPHQLLGYAAFAKTNGLAVELAKMNEIAELLWLPGGLSKEDRDARIVKTIDLFNAIQPADAIESMLATQMIGTHETAVDCLRRAMVPGQTLESREMTMKHAQKLMTLYTQQMAALDKYRGKGQQKIIVERVTVQSGGQAIVGNVETDAVASPPVVRRRKVAPLQITSVPPTPNPLDELPDPVPADKAKTREPRG